MYRALSLAFIGVLLFSTTFILNNKMSLEGGHWLWNAVLRYAFLTGILVGWIVYKHGTPTLKNVFRCYNQRKIFWTIAGGIGFGFYAPLCYAGSHAPGWVIASTWQCTLLASPVILYFFGRKISKGNIALLAVIALGAVIVNLEHASQISVMDILNSAPFVLLAAFAYPFGNQMLKEAKEVDSKRVRHIPDPVLKIPSACVLLMTIGSFPVWILLLFWFKPPDPTWGQAGQTFIVALFAGALGTSFFLGARALAKTPSQTAAVDATQGAEAVFTLIGEILLLGSALPGIVGFSGLIIICVGLWVYAKQQ